MEPLVRERELSTEECDLLLNLGLLFLELSEDDGEPGDAMDAQKMAQRGSR